jgi:hypothetical protein
MGQINPFTGAIPLQPSRSVAERVRQGRANSKNLPEDEAAEHVVENPDAVVMITEDHSHGSPDKKREEHHEEPQDDGEEEKPARLDVTA